MIRVSTVSLVRVSSKDVGMGGIQLLKNQDFKTKILWDSKEP